MDGDADLLLSAVPSRLPERPSYESSLTFPWDPPMLPSRPSGSVEEVELAASKPELFAPPPDFDALPLLVDLPAAWLPLSLLPSLLLAILTTSQRF